MACKSTQTSNDHLLWRVLKKTFSLTHVNMKQMLCYSESSCAEIHFYMDEINRTSFRWVHEQTSASSQLLNCGLTQRDAWGRYDPTFQPDLPPEPQPRPPQRLGGCFHLRNPKQGSCVSKFCCWQLPEFSLSHSSSVTVESRVNEAVREQRLFLLEEAVSCASHLVAF